MHRTSWTSFIVAAALNAAALLLLTPGCDRQQQEAAMPMNLPPAEVAVVTVKPRKVTLTTELPGRTAGYLVAEIRPQVSGLLKKRLFTEGADVDTTTDLYQIDPAPFQAAVDSAAANVLSAQKAADRARAELNASIANVARQKATVAQAQTNRKRYEDLFKDKAVSASDRDQAVTEADVAQATLLAVEAQVESNRAAIAAAEAAIKQAQAALETTKISLNYTTIKAPIVGRIGRSTVTEGAMVTAYQTVLSTVQALDPIYVDVPQSTSELMRLKRSLENGRMNRGGAEANQVKLILEDGTPYPYPATLKFRDVTVDPTTGTVILRLVAPNPDGVLLPGMFVRAIVEEGVAEHAILVPQPAISRDPKGNPMTMVVDPQGKVQVRKVVTDRAMGNQWLIASGLSPGDQVIVEGVQKARPGATVRPVPYGGTAGASTQPASQPAPPPATAPSASRP